ncbi:hypothetical protein TNCV_1175221 [Trichonephila clavipes]|nr:hypothetical protein TNCV_1175221 [Trichonephila clavipes]
MDSYDFRSSTAKNEYANDAYLFQDLIKSNYSSVKRNELLTEMECHDELVKNWGYPTTQEIAMFTPVTGKKQKNKFDSPTKDTTSAKKIKTSSENQFEVLTVDDPPEDDIEDIIIDEEDVRSKTSTPIPHVRPPPPITIDNVTQPAQLLKKMQELTRQKLTGRMKGRSFRVYPETPTAYNQIRKLTEEEKLESFTFQFPEEKEYRVVIKGMPADMPVEDIIEELEEMVIHPKECRVMISRKTGQPMPLFSVFLEKNPDNIRTSTT